MSAPRAKRCARTFFEHAVDDVARELIGVDIVVRRDDGNLRATIVETEAYGGANDPASHAYRGPTPRTQVMFGPAGVLYVYRSYGVHWCVNVVTGAEGDASAVLLRAARLRTATSDSRTALRGPGNLTRGLGITGADTGVDCCDGSRSRIYFERAKLTDTASIGQSVRIGLTKEVDRRSRFFLIGDPAVSAMRPTPKRRPRETT